ncbi:glycosyltransferase family 1 protein [Mycobacterium sp. NPDC003323]
MLRVASVPASHVYVRHLSQPGGLDNVVRLRDPIPDDRRKVPGGWWPPLMLEPGWVSAHHHLFDVFHVHFGFDSIDPKGLAGVVAELKAHRKPLVYTVHDLRNPHYPGLSPHREQQDVLAEAADWILTLTPGAADLVEDRWGRPAQVLPHPHVLSSSRIERPRTQRSEFVVGVHVKSLRANMDPLAILDTLTQTVAALPGATLQIDVHDEIFDPGNHWYAPKTGASLLEYDRHDHVRVRVHPYFTDDELWDYLESLDVSVLPYRFGTHSGWLEACHDLGTQVIAPSCGFYREQRNCEVFGFDEQKFDPDSLHRSVVQTYRNRNAGVTQHETSWAVRREERVAIADAHERVYREVLA